MQVVFVLEQGVYVVCRLYGCHGERFVWCVGFMGLTTDYR